MDQDGMDLDVLSFKASTADFLNPHMTQAAPLEAPRSRNPWPSASVKTMPGSALVSFKSCSRPQKALDFFGQVCGPR